MTSNPERKPTARTPDEVLAHHLRLIEDDDVDTDLAENFAADVVLYTDWGTYRGPEGVRAVLAERLGGMRRRVTDVKSDGSAAYVQWNGERRGVRLPGATSYVIRDGKIRAAALSLVGATFAA